MSHADDLWDNIMAMTRTTSKRKSLQPQSSDKTQAWDDFTKHAALANLLDCAVAHRDLELRKTYIDRIMGLPSQTQRSLMALIEHRKKKNSKTPSKKNRSSKKSRAVANTPSRTTLHSSTPNSHPTDSRSPFSTRNPIASMTPGSNSRRRTQARNLFSTPQGGPRRSFDQAFSPDVPNSERPSSKRIPVAADRSFFSPGLGDTAEYEKEFQELRERTDQLELDLQKSRSKEEETTQKLEDIEAHFRKEMIKIEAEATRREHELRDQYEEKVVSLHSDLETVSSQYEAAERTNNELAGVKDEMELMSHTKAQLAETTERLRNYKEKLQQLTDSKEALKREEEAHSKSVTECLRLENELKTLRPLKRQLEEYKTRAVDAEVLFTESQDELEKIKQKRLQSSDTNNDLEATVLSQMEEIEELRRRIDQEEAAKKEAAGVGDGLSELNPEFKEEVFRLRNENKQLKEFAEKREDDAVTKLEQDLEDTTRLGERYKSQFLSTKGQLETTQDDLHKSRNESAKLQKDLAVSIEQTKMTVAKLEDVSHQLHKCSGDLERSRARESKLEKEIAEWVDQSRGLQHQAEDLSGRLHSCSSDLEESADRECQLQEEIIGWGKELEAAEVREIKLSEQLRKCSSDFKAAEQREADLRDHILVWEKQFNSSQEREKELSEQLSKCSFDLEAARDSESSLRKTLSEVSAKATAAEDHSRKLAEQLEKCTSDLDETRKALLESQENESELQDELADMTSRLEDSETVSKQRMELLQSTRDKLKNSLAEVEDLEKKEENLVAEIEECNEKSALAEVKVESLEHDLAEANHAINDTQKNLAESQQEVAHLAQSARTLAAGLEEWKSKALSAENLTDRLQEELVKTREIVMNTQDALKACQEAEANMKEEITHAGHMLFELEDAVQEETEARKELENHLDAARDDLTKAKKAQLALKKKLTSQIEEESQLSNKYKEDLFHAQQTLNETQSSLGASQHREKMLKHEVAKLQDNIADLEKELEVAQQKASDALIESSQSMDSTREAWSLNAQKEIDEIQSNMNQLLEDERKAKRQVDEAYQQALEKFREESEEDIRKLKDEAAKSLEVTKTESYGAIERLKKEHEEKLAMVKNEGDTASDKLIKKGKGMLSSLKEKAKEEADQLKEECADLEARLEQETKHKLDIALQFKNKVIEYKKKLQFSAGRISNLAADSDDLEEKIKALERERFKLREENDQYRRQLGGRFGDSKMQSQIETLQKEFKNALEETRELKRKLKNQGTDSSSGLSSINENAGNEHSYSRDSVNQSTLVQLRNEYEETIEAMNDEKRELIMRNSASITDVQKAEKRAWEFEQENSTMKEELTSLQLQVERLEHGLASLRQGSPSSDKPSSAQKRSFTVANSKSSVALKEKIEKFEKFSGNAEEDDGVPKPPMKRTRSSEVISSERTDDIDHTPHAETHPGVLTPSQEKVNETETKNESTDKSPFVDDIRRPVQTFADYGGTSPGKDRPPECTQS